MPHGDSGSLEYPPYDYLLDVLGRACPYPAIMAKKKVSQIEKNAVLMVLTDAPNSVENIWDAVKDETRVIGVYRTDDGWYSVFLKKLGNKQ